MNLPPYLSRTPPPINEIEDDDNVIEEFGAFVVSGDLGEEVYDAFEKEAHTLRYEDTISEDSGYWMNSVGQIQSPCDISPLSSSYTNKGNDCVAEDHCTSFLECEVEEEIFHGLDDNSSQANDTSYTSNSLPPADEQAPVCHAIMGKISNDHLSLRSNGIFSPTCEETESIKNSVYQLDSDAESLDIENGDNVHDNVVGNIFTDLNKHELREGNDNNSLEYNTENILPKSITIPENVFVNSCNNLSTFRYSSPSTKKENGFDIHHAADDHDLFFKSVNSKTVNHDIAKDGTTLSKIKDIGPDDDFCDFAGFQSPVESTKSPSTAEIMDYDNEYKCKEVLREEGIDVDFSYSIFTLQSAIKSNIVWNCLQSFEETPAFKYQWASSSTNMKLLQALQIDSRNILHSPWSKATKLYWNDLPSTCMSITFDSEFGGCPAKPISQVDQDSIPDAHFDWVSSGLVNPLQTVFNKDFSNEYQMRNDSDLSKSQTNALLQSLPSLSFVKTHHIVFKRD